LKGPRKEREEGTEDSGNSAFSIQLKKLYRALSNLETKIKQEEGFVGSSMEDGVAEMSGVRRARRKGEGEFKGLIVKEKTKDKILLPFPED
jgi:hypothetical protein